NVEHPLSLTKISMTWDDPEVTLVSGSTGSATGGLDWIARVIEHERGAVGSRVLPARVQFGDAARLPNADSAASVVVTDPPYFDEISYADLSDYFYVWLKRGLGDVYLELFATPLTPQAEEATALKHRHGGSADKAEHP